MSTFFNQNGGPSVLLSNAIWRVVRRNLAGGAKRGLEVEAGERVCGQGGSCKPFPRYMISFIYAFRWLSAAFLRWKALTVVSRVRKESSILRKGDRGEEERARGTVSVYP